MIFIGAIEMNSKNNDILLKSIVWLVKKWYSLVLLKWIIIIITIKLTKMSSLVSKNDDSYFFFFLL